MAVDNSSRVLTSNTGFYYVCYKLSSLGWTVEPSGNSPRNRTLSATRAALRIAIKVKSVNGPLAAGFGTGTLNMPFDYVVVADVSEASTPRCFVLSTGEAKALMNSNEKQGQVSYWLEFKDYRQPAFESRWESLLSGAG